MFKYLIGLYYFVNLRNLYFFKNEIFKVVLILSYYCLEKSLLLENNFRIYLYLNLFVKLIE